MSYIEGPATYKAGGMSGRHRGATTAATRPGWITTDQAAARWGGTSERLARASRRGEIPGVTEGGRLLIHERSAREWVQAHEGRRRAPERPKWRPEPVVELTPAIVPREAAPVPEGWEALQPASLSRGWPRQLANHRRLSGKLKCKPWRLPNGRPAWIARTVDIDRLPAPRKQAAPPPVVKLTDEELTRRCEEIRNLHTIPPPPEVGWDYESPRDEARYREHIRRELRKRAREEAAERARTLKEAS